MVLIDCMPVRAHTPHLIRMVEGKRGAVPIEGEASEHGRRWL